MICRLLLPSTKLIWVWSGQHLRHLRSINVSAGGRACRRRPMTPDARNKLALSGCFSVPCSKFSTPQRKYIFQHEAGYRRNERILNLCSTRAARTRRGGHLEAPTQLPSMILHPRTAARRLHSTLMHAPESATLLVVPVPLAPLITLNVTTNLTSPLLTYTFSGDASTLRTEPMILRTTCTSYCPRMPDRAALCLTCSSPVRI